jgi:hypothetical protein
MLKKRRHFLFVLSLLLIITWSGEAVVCLAFFFYHCDISADALGFKSNTMYSANKRESGILHITIVTLVAYYGFNTRHIDLFSNSSVLWGGF